MKVWGSFRTTSSCFTLATLAITLKNSYMQNDENPVDLPPIISKIILNFPPKIFPTFYHLLPFKGIKFMKNIKNIKDVFNKNGLITTFFKI